MTGCVQLWFTLSVMIYSLAEAHSSMRCVLACENTMYSQNAAVCRQCVQNPPINYQMCRFACDYTQSPDLRSICERCVPRVELSDDLCIHACRFTAFDQYGRICQRCERSPPITGPMCIQSCSNTAFSWHKTICNKCANTPPASFQLCRHACRNTAFPEFRRICNSRSCQWPKYETNNSIAVRDKYWWDIGVKQRKSLHVAFASVEALKKPSFLSLFSNFRTTCRYRQSFELRLCNITCSLVIHYIYNRSF